MKPLSIALLVLFGTSALFFAQSHDINDTGFVLSVIVGLVGVLFVLRVLRGEVAGQVLLGIATSLIIAALFGFSLIGGAIAGVVIIITVLSGRFR